MRDELALVDSALKTEVLELIHAAELERAAASLRRLTKQAGKHAELRGRSESLLGEVSAMRGDFSGASLSFRRAIELLEGSTLHATLARALRAHAKALLVLSSAESARVELTRARSVADRIDDEPKRLLATLETEILAGLVALSAGDVAQAEAACRAARRFFNALDDLSKTPEGRRELQDRGPHESHAVTEGMFFQLAGLVDTRDGGTFARGIDSLKLAVTHFRNHALVFHHARALEALGRAEASINLEQAIDRVEEAHEMYEAMGAEYLATRSRDWLDEARALEGAAGDAPKPRHARVTLEPTATEYCGIFIAGAATKRIVELAINAGAVPGPVLITGETGTGKELVAKAIHASSPRAEHRLLAVNCAAFTESLLETELFGYEKGAFTGATETRKGLFDEADHSTLLLDEIGETTPQFQVKLLRVLQEREFTRVGGQGKRPIRVDVRILAATNRDLEREIADGRFRQDLFFRLNTSHISLVPLRDRPNEIRPLADSLVTKVGAEMGIERPWIKGDATRALERYSWPGNVRQLEGFLRSTLGQVVAETGRAVVTVAYVEERLEPLVREDRRSRTAGSETGELAARLSACGWRYEGDLTKLFEPIVTADGRLREDATWSDAKRNTALALAALALVECDGSPTEAARRLVISRQGFVDYLRENGFEQVKSASA